MVSRASEAIRRTTPFDDNAVFVKLPMSSDSLCLIVTECSYFFASRRLFFYHLPAGMSGLYVYKFTGVISLIFLSRIDSKTLGLALPLLETT